MSSDHPQELWQRAQNALMSAEVLVGVSGDDAASRAYYAAFHGVSALFAARGHHFSKHTAIRAAIHRDLVHTGEWPEELGEAFDALWELRDIGDYGVDIHVSSEDANLVIDNARWILEAVSRSHPQFANSPSSVTPPPAPGPARPSR